MTAPVRGFFYFVCYTPGNPDGFLSFPAFLRGRPGFLCRSGRGFRLFSLLSQPEAGDCFFCFFFNRDPIGAKPPSPVPRPSFIFFTISPDGTGRSHLCTTSVPYPRIRARSPARNRKKYPASSGSRVVVLHFEKPLTRGRSRMGLERSSKVLFYPIQS